jgi:long-chain acyl-CoA synthetase
MVAHPKVIAKLMKQVNRLNAHLPAFERIRKIAILEKELTAESGLLTPSLKLKRRVVNDTFKDVIEGLYRTSV